MSWKNWTFGSTALAALCGVVIVSAAPSFAQDQDQGTPAAQSYQNVPQNGRGGSMQNSNGMTNGMNQGSGTMNSSANTQSLNSVHDAKTTLASAQVQDSNGQQVGQVADVHTARSGHPTKIDVTLTSNNGAQAKTVVVSASKLRYDKTSNTLISNASLNELQSMPAASPTSGM